MREEIITVYFIKGSGLNHTASNNRHAALMKMVNKQFNAIIKEKSYYQQKNILKKLFYGLYFRLALIAFALNIPHSDKGRKNIIFLLSIDAFVALFIKAICILKKNKLIIERNEFPSAILCNKPLKEKLFRFFILWWQYKLYDGLFLMTNELISFYSRYTRKKCVIQKLPMTVDFSRFENTYVSNEEKYLAYTGSLSNEKDGVLFLINAFKKVSILNQDLQLKIIGGSSKQVNELKEYIHKIDLIERVQLYGVINSEQVPKIIQNALILVLPRPDSKQARGGFPTKLGEYLATGKPVIVTSVGEIPAHLKNDDVFFINPDNIEDELVATIKKILDNYDESLRVGSNGKQKAKEMFSLESNMHVLQILLISLLKVYSAF